MRVVWAYQLRAFNESEHADHAEDTIVAYQMMQGLVDLARTFASNRRCSNPLLEHLPYDHESYKLLREFVAAGGLLSYGPSITGMFALAAGYVANIARGARPADMPIEQPTRFELVVNLRTAETLGLKLPATLLARADEQIE